MVGQLPPFVRQLAQRQRPLETAKVDGRGMLGTHVRREGLQVLDPLGERRLTARDEVAAGVDGMDRNRVQEAPAQAVLVRTAEEEAAGGNVGEPGRDLGGWKQGHVDLEVGVSGQGERVGDVPVSRGPELQAV